ncbi:hypothetical protein ACWKWB_14145, partial [Thermomonas fusca]
KSLVRASLFALCLSPALALAQTPPAAPAVTQSAYAADAAFRAIYHDEWNWRMQLAGAWTEVSDETGRKPSRSLPDVSPKAQYLCRRKIPGEWRGMTLACRCGQVEGRIDPRRVHARASCNCRDCRAFARWLGSAGLLDSAGGTVILAMAPDALQISRGFE